MLFSLIEKNNNNISSAVRFGLKIVRTASLGGSNVYPQSMFWAKIRKNVKTFSAENFHFLQHRKICILQGHVFVMFKGSKKNW